jgi:DNA-binding CsgD family transcriptional regulator
MTRRRISPDDVTGHLPPFPLREDLWQAVAESFRLCERHAKIVELVLRDASDDEIAAVLGIAPATVKTLLRRIRDRMNAPTRMQLSSRVLGATVEILTRRKRPPGA